MPDGTHVSDYPDFWLDKFRNSAGTEIDSFFRYPGVDAGKGNAEFICSFPH